MPTTCGIDEYETNDYISCLHGNDMDICMLKAFFDALGSVFARKVDRPHKLGTMFAQIGSSSCRKATVKKEAKLAL